MHLSTDRNRVTHNKLYGDFLKHSSYNFVTNLDTSYSMSRISIKPKMTSNAHTVNNGNHSVLWC